MCVRACVVGSWVLMEVVGGVGQYLDLCITNCTDNVDQY